MHCDDEPYIVTVAVGATMERYFVDVTKACGNFMAELDETLCRSHRMPGQKDFKSSLYVGVAGGLLCQTEIRRQHPTACEDHSSDWPRRVSANS